MMNDSIGWVDILGILFILMMIAYIWPRAKHMWKNSPKGSNSDWMTYAALMAGVVLFVFFLISMVRN